MSSQDLDGKLILVTGASRGIGRAVAIAVAHAGAELIITGRTIGA
ncbi:MAG: SDR family NAD(P)-dependent oxidoreductase, partial [Candidatus Puniceispirillum sp.]